MNQLRKFDISFNGLQTESYFYEYEIDNRFFESFEYSEIQEGAVLNLTSARDGSKNGFLVVKKYEKIEEASFIDYLREGMSFALTIGIDYTSSNELVTEKNSLHYVSDANKNEYEKTIEIILK